MEVRCSHFISRRHRHQRELDFLLASGRPLHTTMTLNPGANQYTGPAYSNKVCFMAVGNIITTVIKGRRAGPMSGLFFRCLWLKEVLCSLK